MGWGLRVEGLRYTVKACWSSSSASCFLPRRSCTCPSPKDAWHLVQSLGFRV